MLPLFTVLARAPLVGAATMAATPCAAQGRPPVAAQIDQLQQQIQALQQQLQELQNQVNASQKVPTPAALSQSVPHVVQSATNRFSLESADGQYSIALTGRLHLDTGDYIRVHPGSPAAPVSNLSSGFNARRARIGVTGNAFGDWTYTFIYDAGNSNDLTPRASEYAQINYLRFKDPVLRLSNSAT